MIPFHHHIMYLVYTQQAHTSQCTWHVHTYSYNLYMTCTCHHDCTCISPRYNIQGLSTYFLFAYSPSQLHVHELPKKRGYKYTCIHVHVHSFTRKKRERKCYNYSEVYKKILQKREHLFSLGPPCMHSPNYTLHYMCTEKHREAQRSTGTVPNMNTSFD